MGASRAESPSHLEAGGASPPLLPPAHGPDRGALTFSFHKASGGPGRRGTARRHRTPQGTSSEERLNVWISPSDSYLPSAPYVAGPNCGWVKVKTQPWRQANRERYKMFEGN